MELPMRWRNALRQLAPLSLALGILSIALKNQLSFYIHPRYQLITTAAAIIVIVIVLIHTYYSIKQKNTNTPSKKNVWTLLAGCTLLFLPAYPLLPQQVEPSYAIPLGDSQAQLCDFDALSHKPHTLAGWKVLFANCDTPGAFNNREITIEGVVAADPTSYERFLVQRLVISCCAVDATLNTFYVTHNGWQQVAAPNTWVRITGTLKSIDPNNRGYSITDATITSIEQPDNPYNILSDDIPTL